jgi:hypothetical protein
MVDLDATFEV